MFTSFDALHTLRKVDELGTFEAAARELHITASAVSQRVKSLEQQIGRVVVVRSKPARLTEAGAVLARLARQFDLLESEALAELGVRADSDRPSSLALAVNADSLATWIHSALSRFAIAHRVVFDITREDQEHTSALLAAGRVLAAVTTDPEPVAGCTVTKLGVMTYRAVATPAFRDTWLPAGPTAAALDAAPMIDFNRKDTLQERWLASVGAAAARPPRHYVPGSTGFALAVSDGMGWGMLPDAQCDALLSEGSLVELVEGTGIDVALHWQQWDLRSPLLDALATEVAAAARTALSTPPGELTSGRRSSS